VYMYLLYADFTDDPQIFGLFDSAHIKKAYLDTKRSNEFYDFSWYKLKIKKFQLNKVKDVGHVL